MRSLSEDVPFSVDDRQKEVLLITARGFTKKALVDDMQTDTHRETTNSQKHAEEGMLLLEMY
jgi:hypothetical protein